jgi:hypothetical protein
VTGLFPCDKNIFKPYAFPLSSEDTHAAPVKHPASVNTSDQPPSSSATFSPFTSAVPLQSSDISSMSSLNLKPNPHDGTAKKIMSSPYIKFVEPTQKKNRIKQATKSKTNHFSLNAILGPSKRYKRRVCRDPTPFDTPSYSDSVLTVHFTDNLMSEMIHDVECLFCTHFSEDHNGEDWIQGLQVYES